MGKVNIALCDLCLKEHRPGEFWWNNANGGEFSVKRDGVNGGYKWENLCPTCRRMLCAAVDGVVDQFKPKQVPQ